MFHTVPNLLGTLAEFFRTVANSFHAVVNSFHTAFDSFRNDSILVRNDANLFGNDLIHLRNRRRDKHFEGNNDADRSYLLHSQVGCRNPDFQCLAPRPSRLRVQGGVVKTGFTGFTGWETGGAAVAAFHPVHPVDPVPIPHRIVAQLDALRMEAETLNRLPGRPFRSCISRGLVHSHPGRGCAPAGDEP